MFWSQLMIARTNQCNDRGSRLHGGVCHVEINTAGDEVTHVGIPGVILRSRAGNPEPYACLQAVTLSAWPPAKG